jgi:ABC-2 type transport system ATP-binding protein
MNLHTASDTALRQASPVDKADDIVIRLEHVGVRYRVPSERIPTFKEYIIRILQRKVSHRDFWALDDVSLCVNKGEVFGIIGNNGAGKSTLLKLVARVLKPTRGRVWVKGRVAPLLEFGAAFHQDLSGRENVYLNGALLGFTQREMDEKFSRIVEFAELGEFIDAPMRTYSSGMWARLGFAIATDIEPDILIVDEVLSVGDEAFQIKSYARMEKFREQGATILFVSHSMDVVNGMCQRVAWVDHGRLQMVGDASEVIQAYRDGRG